MEMYIRIKKQLYNSKTYYYAELVEGRRIGKKVVLKIKKYYGKVENLGGIENIKRINNFLKTLSSKKIKTNLKDITIIKITDVLLNNSYDYANFLLLRKIWNFWNLSQIIQENIKIKRKHKISLSDLIMTMCINRCIEPTSDHKIIQWYKDTPLEMMLGIKSESLNDTALYRALNNLIEIKDAIEKEIFYQLKEKLGEDVEQLFYDITSSYFEGNGPMSLAYFGYSRDHRKDKKQILISLVTTKNGFPITHEVYEGNVADKTTIDKTIKDLKERFKIKRCIFVIDRGMLSKENLEFIETEEYRYIITLTNKSINEIKETTGLTLDEEVFSELKPIIEDKNGDVKLYSKELIKNNIRYIICHNPDKAVDDKEYRKNIIEKAKIYLEKIKENIQNGFLKDRDKILKKITKVLTKLNAEKYFLINVPKENVLDFNYTLNNDKIAFEEKIDGKYFIKTNVIELDIVEIIKVYKNLSIIERAFKTIKSFIKVRPIFHKKENRVKAHVFICVISYLLERTIEYLLKKAGLEISFNQLIYLLKRIKVGKIELVRKPKLEIVRTTNQIDTMQKRIIEIFGLEEVKVD